MPQKTQLAVGLDAGSSRTRCIICALDGDQIRYLSHGLAPSAGWSKGRVSDQMALAESIRAAVFDAERGAQVSVEGVTVGIGGMSVCGAHSRGLYEFGRPREVDAEDLAYAVKLAADPAHTEAAGVAMPTAGVTCGVTVIVTGLDAAVAEAAQPALLVSTQLTTSPLFNPELAYVILFVPALTPLTSH